MSPYRMLITILAILALASMVVAQGGGGGAGGMGGAAATMPGAGVFGGYGGNAIGAPKASVMAVDNTISMMSTQLKQLDVQLGILKKQIAESENRVKSGYEAPDEKLPNLKMQASNLTMAQEQLARDLVSAMRLKTLASPVDVILKSATIRQAAEALSQAAKLSIAVDPKVPQDIRVNAESQNVPLGAVLEVIAQNAGLIIAPTAQDGLLLRLPGKLVVDGVEYSSEGSSAPWSDDWGMEHTPFAAVGRRWLDLFNSPDFGRGYGGYGPMNPAPVGGNRPGIAPPQGPGGPNPPGGPSPGGPKPPPPGPRPPQPDGPPGGPPPSTDG